MQFFPINRLRIFLRGIRCCAESDFIPGMIPKCCDQFGRSNNQLTNSARCRSRSYKKYRRELKNLLGNLQVDLDALNAGAMPAQIQRGFLHPEPYGVPAIDQRGDGQGLKEFRLYIYPDMEQHKLYLLALGDKNSQKSDIASCTRWVCGFREQTETDKHNG